MKVTGLFLVQMLFTMWPVQAGQELTEADDLWHMMKAHQEKILLEKQKECFLEIILENHPNETGEFCPTVWDGILCWPLTRGNSIAQLPCPSYVSGFNEKEYATKSCMADGTWFIREHDNVTWSNYSDCVLRLERDVLYSRFEELLPTIKLIARVGYSVSLIFLSMAMIILAIIKRLRCPRNSLHMHLFASFIMRAFMALLKDNLFVNGVGLAEHMVMSNNGEDYITEYNVWDCKLVTSLWQYFLMANYCWILMEGLYLHNLIFLALFSDTSGICLYVALGWGLPLVFIIPWVILRVNIENTFCWTTNENSAIFWIIRGPITLSILINFIFFINIARILFLKLTSTIGSDARKHRYKKLAKSTLVLVPLFGVHYMVFLAMSLSSGMDITTELVWLICDMSFAAFQGFFVAILYCFMNGEVQMELKRKWQNWYQNNSISINTGQSPCFLQSLFRRSHDLTCSSTENRHNKRRNNEKSPCIQKSTECTLCTTTYNNNPSPRLGRPDEDFRLINSSTMLSVKPNRNKSCHEFVDISNEQTLLNGTKPDANKNGQS